MMSRRAWCDQSRDPRPRTSESANRRLFSNVSRKVPPKFSVENNLQKFSTMYSCPIPSNVHPLPAKENSSNSRLNYDSRNENIHHFNDVHFGAQKIIETNKESTESGFYPREKNSVNDESYENNQSIREYFIQHIRDIAVVERPTFPGGIDVSDVGCEEEKGTLTSSMSAPPSTELTVIPPIDAIKSSPLINSRLSNEISQSPPLSPPNDAFVPHSQTPLANEDYFHGRLVIAKDAAKFHHANRVYEKWYYDLKNLKPTTGEKVHANNVKGLKSLYFDFKAVYTLARTLESANTKQDAEIIEMKKTIEIKTKQDAENIEMKKTIDQMKDEAKNSAEEKETKEEEFRIFKIEAEAQLQKEKEKNKNLKIKNKERKQKYKKEIKAERDKVRAFEAEKKDAENSQKSMVEGAIRAQKSMNQFVKSFKNCPIVSNNRPAPKPHNTSELDGIKLKKIKK